MDATRVKDEGNEAFKAGQFANAISLYSRALSLCDSNKTEDAIKLKSTLLCNRAACHLKLSNFQNSVDDCNAALELTPMMPKALYRRAQGSIELSDCKSAFKDLSMLTRIEPHNKECTSLLRKVSAMVEAERKDETEVKKLLTYLRTLKPVGEEKKIEDALKGLIGLCIEEKLHSCDLGRKGGVSWLCTFLKEVLDRVDIEMHQGEHDSGKKESSSVKLATLTLRVLGAATSHDVFVNEFVCPNKVSEQQEVEGISYVTTDGKLLLDGVSSLMSHPQADISHVAVTVVMRVLKSVPPGIELPPAPKSTEEVDRSPLTSNSNRVEEIDDEDVEDVDMGGSSSTANAMPAMPPALGALLGQLPKTTSEKEEEKKKKKAEEEEKKKKAQAASKKRNQEPPKIDLYLSEGTAKSILRGFLGAMQHNNVDIHSIIFDALSAFVSDSTDYFSQAKVVDTRMETLEERKERFKIQRILKARSQSHGIWAIEVGLLDALAECIDHESPLVRQRASTCCGRLIIAIDDEIKLKGYFRPFLVGAEDVDIEVDMDSKESEDMYQASMSTKGGAPPVNLCRRRAALEVALFIAKPDLGVWALRQIGGIAQLLFMVSTGDERCLEVASEVFCMCANVDTGSALLGPVISSGALNTLMRAPNAGVRAAAASTISKLAIKAKALKEDSDEVSQILNTVLSVIKSPEVKALAERVSNSKSSKKGGKDKSSKSTSLPSFSKLDDYGSTSSAKSAASSLANGSDYYSSEVKYDDGAAITSVERAIEVLAAMIGKSHVKEEVVHGSHRVAPSVTALLALELDVRSTAAYGLAHILAALTVTNRELHVKALAEKDMTIEQYEQLQNLQRIKTKDENGNDIVEALPEEGLGDMDSPELCKRRIQRLVASGVIPVLVKFLSDGSSQTKEAAARAFRQICVDESSRGAMIQQGGFKACCTHGFSEDATKITKFESAHAIAKTLVTTNPNVLSEHVRLSAFAPLLFLCQDVDASSLQQFETLLAITNLVSIGEAEKTRFASVRGISAVHYLIFSDHPFVRRAATEVFCNISHEEGVLKILRQPEKLKLWLGLCEDWDNEANPEEAYMTSRAASGTLAMACEDNQVCEAMLSQDCASTIVQLLESEKGELIHRALVIISTLATVGGKKMALHLVRGNVIPAIGVVVKIGDPRLAELAKGAAGDVSKAMSLQVEELDEDNTEPADISNA